MRSQDPKKDIYFITITFKSYVKKRFVSSLKDFLKENDLWIYFERYWGEKKVRNKKPGINYLQTDIASWDHKIWDPVFFHFFNGKKYGI